MGILAPKTPNLEYAALQTRMALELMVLGSFVANRAKIEEITTALRNKDVKSARKLAKNANSNYWPKPAASEIVNRVLKSRPRQVQGQVLSEDRWGPAFGLLSDLLHPQNPFAPPLDIEKAAKEVQRVTEEIAELLKEHAIFLADGKGVLQAKILNSGEVEVLEASP